MKMIMAIINIDRINETKRALSDAGLPSFTATGKVFGRGEGLWEAKVIEGVTANYPEAVELLGNEPRLRPQRLLTIVVDDKKKDACVKAIIESNTTEHPGDGKVFVLPMTEAIKVRTGEAGVEVLD